MNRLIILLIFIPMFFDSNGQNPKEKKSAPTVITVPLDNIINSLKDSVLLQQLTKIYGDSASQILDIFLNDTNFLKSLGDSANFEHGEFASSKYKLQFPLKPLGWTSDFEHIFSSEQIATLDSIIHLYEKETTNQIAIITLDSGWTTKDNFDSLILTIHNDWGVGIKGINNGIVIGISTGLRRIRISNGNAIEAKISNAETKKIIDNIILPEFKKGNYFEGTKAGLLALIEKTQ